MDTRAHEEFRSILFTRSKRRSAFLRSKDKGDMLTNGLSPVFGGLSVKEWSDLILTFFGRGCLPKSRPASRASFRHLLHLGTDSLCVCSQDYLRITKKASGL